MAGGAGAQRAQEDEQRWHRQRERLLKERTGHRNRIRSLLVLQGLRVKSPGKCRVNELRDWQAQAAEVLGEWEREQQRLELVEQQLRELEQHLVKRWEQSGSVALARQLLVALWRYLETGEVPAGAVMKPA